MEAPFLTEAQVSGKYTPTPQELPEILQKIKLKEELKSAHFESSNPAGIIFSLDSLEKSHLLALAILKKGIEIGLWDGAVLNDTFYSGKPQEDFRFDSYLCMSEKIVQGGVVMNIFTRFNDTRPKEREENAQKYTSLIKDIVKEDMPQVSDETKDFQFK